MRGRQDLKFAIRIACIAGLLTVPALSVGAAPPPPPPSVPAVQAPSVALSFVIDEIDPESGERIASRISTQLRTTLTDADYQVVEDPNAADDHLEVSILLTDVVARAYEIRVAIGSGSGAAATLVGPAVCHACTEARVVDFVMAERSQILAELEARSQARKPPVMAIVPVLPPTPPVEPEPRRMAHAGIVLSSLGVASLVAGGSLWGLSKPNDGYSYPHEFRPAGIALTAVGVLATITGVSLIAVDVSRHRKRSAKLSLRMTPGYAGIHVQARF